MMMKEKRKIRCRRSVTALLMGLALGFPAHAQQSGPQSGPQSTQEPAAPGLENWLGPLAAFWTWSPEVFTRETRTANFRWMEQNTAARAAPLQGEIFGKPVIEAVVRFQDDTPHTFVASYYNRGDVREELSEADFQNLVRELSTTISRRVRRQPMPGNQSSRQSSVRDDSLVWQLETHRFELAYAYTPPRRDGGRNLPFRAEYVRLTVSKFRPGDIPAHANTRVNVYEIRQNIQRNPENGDVWIAQVPMVDQGPKGYCAAATAERTMRYFGQSVDQHQIAQIADTTAEGGTSFDDFKSALQAIARQYQYSFNTHIDWNFRDFQRLVDDYNRTARQTGQPEINLPAGGVIQINQIYAAFHAETLVAARQRRRADFNRFEERIRRYVDGGAPLIWGVMLGVIPEQGNPQASGGHLRLIIGYNAQTREVLFSDSWGRGHELKRMPIDQAFAITTSLYSLEPRGLRL